VIERYFLVYEGDKDKAVRLVRRIAPALGGLTVEAIGAIPVNLFTRQGMQPGQVKPHIW
jgi:hypothetical protein